MDPQAWEVVDHLTWEVLLVWVEDRLVWAVDLLLVAWVGEDLLVAWVGEDHLVAWVEEDLLVEWVWVDLVQWVVTLFTLQTSP